MHFLCPTETRSWGTRLAKRSGLRKAKVGTFDRGQGRPEIGSLLCKGVESVGWCLQHRSVRFKRVAGTGERYGKYSGSFTPETSVAP
jgi:hypothetical protein